MAAGGRRGGLLIILIAIVLILGVAAAYYFLVLRQPATTAVPGGGQTAAVAQDELVNVVITTQTITRGSVITEDRLDLIQLPRRIVPEGLYFQDKLQVIGLRAKLDMDPQYPVTRNMVVESTAGSLTAFDVKAGMTAVSIPISDINTGQIGTQSGDHVMVIGCFMFTDLDPNFQTALPNKTTDVTSTEFNALSGAPQASSATIGAGIQGRFEVDPQSGLPLYVIPSEETQRPRLVCQTVVQDAQVVKLIVPPTPAVEEGQPTPTPAAPTALTLSVSPQDAVLLYYVMNAGAEINLALRSAGDAQQIVTQPVTLQFVMDQKNIPLPAKLPYGLEPRLGDIKATDVVAPAQ